ncbi:sulfur carrier protein ThiS [Candidatus Persebacteraceae bacterium Df01]|jgi:sulfur carrier protein|uniref:Sulfur carrier protein ThiS n=1 Tax=Candidatus Doriopsillibacter californiensis TaxID=2970740 RepID=A0ABT7QLG8_9GAMM|nr:sulfur carrier protein ThiS [Candidatus Persebacteraceae bacterium Df01]
MEITCTVNGIVRHLNSGGTVSDLLNTMNLRGQKIAVEKNGIIVPQSRHQNECLHNGDVIEIVTAVGGG